MGWVDAAAFLDQVARQEAEELDRLAAFREPVKPPHDMRGMVQRRPKPKRSAAGLVDEVATRGRT
jgi:hypothetical protein